MVIGQRNHVVESQTKITLPGEEYGNEKGSKRRGLLIEMMLSGLK